MEMTRAMLIQAGAHVSLWGEAIQVAAFVHNCTIQQIGDRTATPSQILFGTIPDFSKLRVFGCDVWHTLPHDERSKLSPRAEKAMFVGYSSNGSYRILKPNSMLHPIVTRDVTFDESSFTVSAELVSDLDDLRHALRRREVHRRSRLAESGLAGGGRWEDRSRHRQRPRRHRSSYRRKS